uniref:hypothetical protein n=1 Tax=Shewanella sp. TaxID=50422 RepID=UPI00404823FF
MPYVRKTKKRTVRKKRTTKKRGAVFRLQKQMPVGFPKTNAVKLRYVEHVTLDAGIGAIASYAYRANSCFDPNYTGTGHQPNGFDQWSTFYNHYIVVGALMKATFTMADATAAGGIAMCGIFLSDDTTHSTDPLLLMEQSQNRRKLTHYSVNSGRPRTVRKGYSAKKFFNVTNVTDNWTRLGATISASPSEVAFFIPWTANPNAAVDPPAMSVLIEIDFICIFSEPKELAYS